VVVARGFCSGHYDWAGTAGHLGYVALWGAAGTALSVVRLRRKLYS
jgi:hypothetical protein